MGMSVTDGAELSIVGATANCGNGTLGLDACAKMVDLLDKDTGSADILIINCQKVSLQATLKELKNAIPENSLIEVMGSDLRVTRTNVFGFDAMVGRTGIATIVLYRKDKVSNIQFKPEASISTTVDNTNKGGLVNALSIKSADGSEYSIRTISAHLDTYSESNRMNEWHGIKAATYADAQNWDALESSIPDLQVAGFDANTRNLLMPILSSTAPINLWHEEKLDPRIAPFILAPLGETLYGDAHTYKVGSVNADEADSKRPGYVKSGSLDFVSIQNNTQYFTSHWYGEFNKHYKQASASLPLEKGSLRDHCVIIGQPSALPKIQTKFDKVKFYLANELRYAAPTLSEDIALLRDSEKNRLCLLEIYHYYLKGGILLDKVKFAEGSSVNGSVDPWFLNDSLDTFNWQEKQLARGSTGERLSLTSSEHDVDLKRIALSVWAEKHAAKRKTPVVPQPAPEESVLLDILSKIPFIARLIHRLSRGSSSAYALATLDPADIATTTIIPEPIANVVALRWAYSNTGLIAAIANFIELPLMYFGSWMLGKPNPVTMTVLGEWAYSIVLLGLTILSLAFPPAAPFVLGVSVFLGFITSVYYYKKFIDQEHEVQGSLLEMSSKIENSESKIRDLEQKIKDLLNGIDFASIENLNELDDHFSNLSGAENELMELRVKQQELTQKAALFSSAHLMDRVVGLGFSTMAVIGFGLLITGTPAGWIVLSAVSALALLYTVGQLVSPLVVKLVSKLSSPKPQTEAPSPEEIIINGLDYEDTLDPQSEPQNMPSPIGLGGKFITQISEQDTKYHITSVTSSEERQEAEEESHLRHNVPE